MDVNEALEQLRAGVEALRADLDGGPAVDDPDSAIRAVVDAFMALDAAASRGTLPAGWLAERARRAEEMRTSERHGRQPADRRALDRHAEPPALVRRVPGATGR